MEKLKLLIPLDATPFSRKVLAQVYRLFPPERFTVQLLHVHAFDIPTVSDSLHYAYGVASTVVLPDQLDKDGFDKAARAAKEKLDQDAEAFREHNYEVTAEILTGEPVQQIVSFITEKAVNVVAMSTHGRTGLGQLFLGSIAQAVVSRITIPVLLLHPEEDQA